MEKIVLLPGFLMAGCIIGAFVMMFRTKSEVIDAPLLVKFFGLEILFPKYLTEQGRKFRRHYWQLFFLAFAFGALTILTMYFFIPEFSQEVNQVRANA